MLRLCLGFFKLKGSRLKRKNLKLHVSPFFSVLFFHGFIGKKEKVSLETTIKSDFPPFSKGMKPFLMQSQNSNLAQKLT